MGDLKAFSPKMAGRLLRFSFRLVPPDTLLVSVIADPLELAFLWPFPLGLAEGSLTPSGYSKRLSRSGVRQSLPGVRGSNVSSGSTITVRFPADLAPPVVSYRSLAGTCHWNPSCESGLPGISMFEYSRSKLAVGFCRVGFSEAAVMSPLLSPGLVDLAVIVVLPCPVGSLTSPTSSWLVARWYWYGYWCGPTLDKGIDMVGVVFVLNVDQRSPQIATKTGNFI